MGKDIRGIERGKCACGECDDFMRSDEATCGYCGCLPTRHSRKDARSSSDSALRHQEDGSGVGTSGSLSPEKWKDEDLGWFPNPKGEYTEFSNSILPKFYLSFWTTCPYKERFRRCFVTERKRQWDVREALKGINQKLAFVTSDNPAAAGRFMQENFNAKRHDATTIRNNTDELLKLKVKIDELNAKVTEDDNALFDASGRHIKSGQKVSHDSNREFLESLKSIKETVGETMELLEKARDKVASIFPLKQGNALKRKSRMQKQNRHKSEKRRRLRYKENEEAIKRKILQIQGDTELTLDKDFVIDHDILIPDAIATPKVHEMSYLSSILNNMPATTQAVQTIKASLSKPCFRKLVRIEACHAKQTRGDKHVTIQNKAAVAPEQQEDVGDEKDQEDKIGEVDDEEEEDDDSSSSFVEDND